MRKAQNTETWHGDITALILHRISLFKFDEIEGKIKDTHERHLVTSPQQFHECIFLYFFLPFLFLNISRVFKWVKVSFTLSCTRGAAKHATEVTSLKSQTQKTDSAVALNINYTAQTLSFPLELAPCFSCLQTCKQCLDVLCAPLSSILQKRKKKTTNLRGESVHLTNEQQREGTWWEMLASDMGKWEAKREVSCQVLWVSRSSEGRLCKTKRQEEICSLYACMYWERKQMIAKDTHANFCQEERDLNSLII